MMKLPRLLPGLLVLLLTLSGCQSGSQSGSGLEDGSAAPELGNVVDADSGPDGAPDECDPTSEGTSTTLGCP